MDENRDGVTYKQPATEPKPIDDGGHKTGEYHEIECGVIIYLTDCFGNPKPLVVLKPKGIDHLVVLRDGEFIETDAMIAEKRRREASGQVPGKE